MKLSASYHCKDSRLDIVRYPIALLNNALQFALKSNKTIIVEILTLAESNLSLARLESILQEVPQIIYDCYQMEDVIYLFQHGITKIMYHYPITTYNDLWALLQLKPQAIVIGEPLIFELKKVRTILDNQEHHIDLYAVPHIGRPTAWNHLRQMDNGLRHFWITPQTVNLYEPYIDVLELYDGDEKRENTLVNVYAARKYLFALNSLLRNCESEVLCDMITEEAVTRRQNCGQHCMYGSSGCHYCDRLEAIIQLAKPNHS